MSQPNPWMPAPGPQPAYPPGPWPAFPAPGAAQPGGPNPFGDPNPYAAPQFPQSYAPIKQQTGIDGLWREGDLLVMHKLAPLPPICVKSGQPATKWLK